MFSSENLPVERVIERFMSNHSYTHTIKDIVHFQEVPKDLLNELLSIKQGGDIVLCTDNVC